MRSRLLAPVVGALLLVLGVALLGEASSRLDPDGRPGAYVVGAADDTTTPFNLVSVPALIGHRYDGHDLRLGAALDRTSTYRRQAISYVGDGIRLTGTLTTPLTPGRHPVVLALHGWAPQPHYVRGAGLLREEARLASLGFVVLHPDYRNFGGSDRESGRPVARPLGYPADALNAVVALHRARLPGIDLGRLAILGRSMGGGVALQAAVARPSWFDAVVLYSPVSTEAAQDFDRFAAPDPGLRRRVTRAYGDPESAPDVWRQASVANYLGRLTMPVRIHHGTADPRCPEQWSVETTGLMRAAGVDVRLRTYAGEPHRFRTAWPTFMGRVDRFLTSELHP